MKNQKIIISGPPGSGKTTIINELQKKGYYCLKEINPSNIQDLKIKSDKSLLSDFLFKKRQKQHNQIINKLAFYDRSMIDVIAYLHYWNKTYPKAWDTIIKNCQYSNNVFYTPSWKKIYTPSKNRLETYEDSQLIEKFIKETYLSFGYTIIEVPKKDVEQRTSFIINNI